MANDCHLMNSSGSNVGRVHARPWRPLVEFHHFFALLEEPEEGGNATDVENVSADAHQMV